MERLQDTTPRPPPDLEIPASSSTVKVSIIDTTTRISNIKTDLILTPRIEAFTHLDIPSYSILVEHEGRNEKVLFDLGVPKNWTDVLPGPVAQRVIDMGWKADVQQDVAEILEEHGIKRDSINAVIWSHWHWDHVGNPALFPSSTTLIVGPGFKDEFVPGWPTNPESRVAESAWAGRELREIDFHEDGKRLKLGRFNAYDYFGDGSFYVLDSPGHATGHLCGLARCTAGNDKPTFMFLSGDATHHGGEYRPTVYHPLPKTINPDPLRVLSAARQHACPGEIFLELHPKHSPVEPFFHPTSGSDLDECKESIRKLEEFDASEDVLCFMAHDNVMLDIIDTFPKTANDWKEKKWKELGMWRFLGDFVSDDERTLLTK